MEANFKEALRKCPADYAEIRWEAVERSRVAFQRDQLLALEHSREAGGVVRALVEGCLLYTSPSPRD